MTIFVTWQLRVTLDSIHNSCDALYTPPRYHPIPSIPGSRCKIHLRHVIIRKGRTLVSYLYFILPVIGQIHAPQRLHDIRRMANHWLRDHKILFLLLALSIFSLSGSQSTSSSLFETSKALSSSKWEQYKMDSQPSTDLMQCLARCELHQNDANHPG